MSQPIPPSSAASNGSSPRAKIVLAALLLLIAMWQFWPDITQRDFHRDEARWIHRGKYVRELLHPFGAYWDEGTWSDGVSLDERNRLRAQPPVGSYLMGIGFLLQGEPLPNIGYWNMDQDEAWNAAQGNMPSDAMLHTAATLGALTVVIVFLLGTRLTTTLGAFVGGLYLALHPLTINLTTFAGSDSALVFFIALSALLAARLAEQPTWPRALALGVAIGLGGGVKLSPIGIAAATAVIGGYLLWRKHRKLGVMLLSTPIVAAITFVGTYPYLWRNPIQHSLDILRYRTMSFEVQGSMWNQVAIESRAEAFNCVWDRFGSEEWSLLGRAITVSWPLENLLALLGVAILAGIVLRRGLASPAAMIALVMGASTAITFFGLQLDWARYHFPILVAIALCIGVTIGATHLQLRQLVRTYGSAGG